MSVYISPYQGWIPPQTSDHFPMSEAYTYGKLVDTQWRIKIDIVIDLD
jgi:hypothetical protein